MNLVFFLYKSILVMLEHLNRHPDYDSVSNSSETIFNTTSNSSGFFLYPEIETTGKELFFYAHGDWGKSGYYDNDVSKRLLKEDKEGAQDREQGEHENENHEHEDHDKKQELFWQGSVARAMLSTANKTKPEFVLALGDNFYADGVQSVNDSLWYSHFRDVYFRTNELRGVPWHPVIGNHDLGYGNSGVQAQVDRTAANTSDDDGVWSMPGTNYTFKASIRGSPGFLQVVAVDTTWLAPSENEATDEQSSTVKLSRLKSQLSNLFEIFQETLHYPRPTWLLVAGHYPLHSHGEKGDNSELLTYLLPFLQHYGVHSYLCGHDHINEHLSSSGIEFYVAGASSMTNTLDENTDSTATLNWAGESFAAFTRFTATTEQLIVDYIDVNGTIAYRYTQTNANPTPTGTPTYHPTQAPTSIPSSAPSSRPTSLPTIEVTMSFCDNNPDLCGYYLNTYGITLTSYPADNDSSSGQGSNSTSKTRQGTRTATAPHTSHSKIVLILFGSSFFVVLLVLIATCLMRRKQASYAGLNSVAT